jgi:hypothetical protein
MNHIREPKSGNDWNELTVAAYNIRVEFQDASTFFGVPHLPDPVLTSDDVLNATDFDQATTDDGFAFLFGLRLPNILNEESPVHDFVAALFHSCGYTGIANRRFTRTKKDIGSHICGKYKYAKVDACILDDKREIILVVQEHKWHFDDDFSNPEPQVIAKAIAAFAENNVMRKAKLPLPVPPCQSKIMLGITFTHGTFPTFYKIPVSTDLVTAVERGQFPEQETVVHAHVPVLPPHKDGYSEMVPLDNRKAILSCFEAFKKFVIVVFDFFLFSRSPI